MGWKQGGAGGFVVEIFFSLNGDTVSILRTTAQNC